MKNSNSFSPPTSKSSDIIAFLEKGVWLSLHVFRLRYAQTIQRDYVMREVDLVQDKHFCLKSIYFKNIFLKMTDCFAIKDPYSSAGII